MIRLFETHKVREELELGGLWDFTPVKDDEISPESYMYRMPVPGCWELHPELLTYRGKGVYRRTIALMQKTSLRFEFKGVSHTANVYFDHQKIAHHYNAYTPFSTVIADVEPGEHELTVLVDNSFSDASALHIPNDYYTYGGMIRPVVMQKVNGVFIERIEFTPFRQEDCWAADIKVFIENISQQSRKLALQGRIGDRTFDMGTCEISATHQSELSKTVAFPEVKSWSGDEPNLYLLDIQLFDENSRFPLDDYIDRVGFRTITVQNETILVNGKEIFLKGFNRHEDHPSVGASFPLQLMVQDMDIMQHMGANTVRTSHYPNDERFLDLCDERGIYVWEENHARGLDLKKMQNPNFEKQCEDCNREMVQSHYNHPSIVIWGILNECASETEEGRRIYKRQFEQIRAMDTSRPLTFASNKWVKDLCLDLVDIVSYNTYPGWYWDTPPIDDYHKLVNYKNAHGGANKPFIVSEFGGDGIYGYRDEGLSKGSEEKQADIIGAVLDTFMGKPDVSGVIIWQYCDCRISQEDGWAINRACSRNNKGIVDRYRRPKLAAKVVKQYFERAADQR
ncbi:glycoside hydrolase family 2 protein [Paenibacillus cymbidii]|uniref:glycoside hydrolase family 2 protein n=1 Tax=Paenibacillus cymbidii TaxID=1639034 RepID=UPI0010821A70|nr:glycoside hydrolase family 2 TIM barrel-domain containing protein [Paenibacillus cymbidii]